ncbi:hypothetical protein KJ765_04635 [Candidatus Micrarchaeota archaeon]|nr:hypothetical protein [Candidatus Micrarchaeota archaeon]
MSSKRLIGVLIAAAFLVSLQLGYYAIPTHKHVSFFAPAITEGGKGTLVQFDLHSYPGSGRILVNIDSASFDPSVEVAFRKAVHGTENYLGLPFNGEDLVLEVRSKGEWFREVSGESAGAIFAASLVALRTNRQLRDDVMVSARLDEDGNLLAVGGIEEKILAAEAFGKRVFLVSDEQDIRYQDELEKDIRVLRVGTIEEALPYLLS